MSDTAIVIVPASEVRSGDYLMNGCAVVHAVPCGAVLPDGSRRAVDIQWEQNLVLPECFYGGEWEPRCSDRFTSTHGAILRATETVRVIRVVR